ncbi:MAG: glycosyltransferase family 1 protein [Hyphomicrobiales bacterium]|nr:MAG: glycosyltransferase family 1 protein [Hyphomicrobiales bacterium]
MAGSQKKIIISINTSWNIFNFRAGLIQALIDAGYKVVAVAPQDEYSERLEALGCRFIPLPMDNKGTSPVNDIILFFRYLQILRHERPDAFLGYTIKPNVYGSLAANRLKIPVINNVSGLGTAFIRENFLTKIVQSLYRWAFRRSHMVFFQNGDDRALFVQEKLVKLQSTDVLPGSGINLEYLKPDGHSSPNAGEPYVFLLIARLVFDKGIREYVEAARIVRNKMPNVKFQILGFLDVENRTAVKRDEVDGWVKEGTIDYLGTTDDVRPFIAASHCVVLPSYREGTPRTLLEAAAMGKSLITTDVPGCREVVDHEKNGFLCRVRDPEHLAERMLNFIELTDDERTSMGKASRKKVEKEFDERIVINRYLETLESIFNKTG